jgi:ectoine hydroxylase-related dioxygenase (phytanoyl-CoA dioxygenase family)
MGESGVLRLDKVLPNQTADLLRKFVLNELEKARSDIPDSENASKTAIDPSNRFSEVLSSENRWDFRLKITPEVDAAIRTVLAPGAPVGDLLQELVSDNGKLFELGSFVTMKGAARQDVHPDTQWSCHPAVFTCLFALQDIDADMGPTVFFPGTHTKDAIFNIPIVDGIQDSTPKVEESIPFALATLARGDAAVYDSRTLHCGGANVSDNVRVIFYFSFLNAAGPLAEKKDFWNVTSLLPEYVDKFRLSDFRA